MNYKKIILLICLFVAMPAFAELTTQQQTSLEYNVNTGWSDQTAHLIRYMHAAAAGEKYEPIEKEQTMIEKIIFYFDPGKDDGKLMKHSIQPGNSFNDL